MTRKVLAVIATTALLAACGQPTRQQPRAQGDRSCATENLNLVQPGQLTIGTDNPAFPPWFEGGTPEDSPWEINDPSTGEGFESAVAYAVAEELGFTEDQVEWVEVPFNQSFKPGPKDFDFDINQISYRPQRDEAVDFSQSYYDVNQALVALKDNPIGSATTLEALRQYRLGAPVATTSFDYIENNIQPEEDPGVYDTLNDAISALENGQIDGVVVDLPTGFFIVAVQVDRGVLVGQFPTVGQQEYFGMVFEQGNPLADCVNRALDALKADGTLEEIQDTWLSQVVDVPPSSSGPGVSTVGGTPPGAAPQPVPDLPRGDRRSRILGGGVEGGRSVAIAVVSTVVFLTVVVLVVINSPGWPEVRRSFFNAEVFLDSFPDIAERFVKNVVAFLVAEVFILVLALFIAVLRSLPGPVFFPLRAMAVVYTDLFRGIPTILVIYILGFGAPALQLTGVPKSELFWGIVALVLVYSAYVAEVYRAGIESVHPSQVAAARSLGLTRWKALRFVVLPQAVRRVIPPLLNDFIGLQKDTALLALIGVLEVFRQSQVDVAGAFNFTPYLATALLFVVITIPLARLTDWLIGRERSRREVGGVA